jgi:hypothetical protein
MTKTNHRLHQIARRSPAAYDKYPLRELAYFDAVNHMAAAKGHNGTGSVARATFGQRTPSGIMGCATRCDHPGCAQGCTLAGRREAFLRG